MVTKNLCETVSCDTVATSHPACYSFNFWVVISTIHDVCCLTIFVSQLIYDTIKSNNSGGSGFDDCLRFFPPELFSGRYFTLSN